MKSKAHGLLALSLIHLTTGCSMLSSRMHLAAKPLNVSHAKLVEEISSKKTFIGALAFDSAVKCDEFIATLTGDQASLNTGTSIASTVLTAVATAVTPIRTAHAFSAGATIASSSRDAINSNLYNKGTFAAFHSALQSTYYKNLNAYLEALSITDEAQIDVGVEATKLQTIHATCSLAAAEASILATIQPPQPDKNGTEAAAEATAPADASPEATPSVRSKTKGAISGARIW